ncbi:hypothetical protein YC2023_079479 [Brassica napus]
MVDLKAFKTICKIKVKIIQLFLDFYRIFTILCFINTNRTIYESMDLSVRPQENDIIRQGWYAFGLVHSVALSACAFFPELTGSADSAIHYTQSSLPNILQPLWRRLRRALDQLETDRVMVTHKEGNLVASSIADALEFQWQQSYVARNGPGWLQLLIRKEAARFYPVCLGFMVPTG